MFVFLRLQCDQECATLERNRRLAEALQIDPSSDPFGSSSRSTSVYSDSLKEDARSVLMDSCFRSFCKKRQELQQLLIQLHISSVFQERPEICGRGRRRDQESRGAC